MGYTSQYSIHHESGVRTFRILLNTIKNYRAFIKRQKNLRSELDIRYKNIYLYKIYEKVCVTLWLYNKKSD